MRNSGSSRPFSCAISCRSALTRCNPRHVAASHSSPLQNAFLLRPPPPAAASYDPFSRSLPDVDISQHPHLFVDDRPYVGIGAILPCRTRARCSACLTRIVNAGPNCRQHGSAHSRPSVFSAAGLHRSGRPAKTQWCHLQRLHQSRAGASAPAPDDQPRRCSTCSTAPSCMTNCWRCCLCHVPQRPVAQPQHRARSGTAHYRH